MDQFVSHYLLRLDAKGRISVPALFRAVLARDGFEGLYCYPALDRPALDAGGNALLAEIQMLIAGYAPYSEQREQFALSLYGTSETLKIDSEGRVVLTETLKAHAGITDAATFVGGGYTRAILQTAGTRVVAIDRDQTAIAQGAPLVEQEAGRLELVEDRFSNLDAILESTPGGANRADGMVFDLGVSSMQLDEA